MRERMVRIPGAIASGRFDDYLELTPEQARRLAQSLIAAADVVEQLQACDLGPLQYAKWTDQTLLGGFRVGQRVMTEYGPGVVQGEYDHESLIVSYQCPMTGVDAVSNFDWRYDLQPIEGDA